MARCAKESEKTKKKTKRKKMKKKENEKRKTLKAEACMEEGRTVTKRTPVEPQQALHFDCVLPFSLPLLRCRLSLRRDAKYTRRRCGRERSRRRTALMQMR